MKTNCSSRALICAFFLTQSIHAFAQGLLTPPGAPAPTMKTLDQVEPRKPINATNTPGDATNVFRITASGSYYLSGPVTGVSGKNGISIEASDVTVDLRGFTLGGVPGSFDGLHAAPGSTRLTVRNGTISNWGGDGVDEVDESAEDGIYESIHATGNGGDGLRLGEKCVISACKFDQNVGYGVSVGGRATIKDCTANDNGLSGFYFGAGSILDSVASSNGDSGIEVFDEPVLVKNCVAFENSDAGLRAGTGAKFSDCISRENFMGIDVGYFGTVTNCTVKNNGLGIFGGGSNHIVGNTAEGNGDAINLYENRNVIDGNQVINGGTGIKLTAVRNLIIRNMVGNNSNNFDVAAGNRFGPIVDITTGATPAVSGNSAADTTTTTHPWANLTYCQEPP